MLYLICFLAPLWPQCFYSFFNHSAIETLASMLFLLHGRHTLSSGPLSFLFSLPEIFSKISAWRTHPLSVDLYSNHCIRDLILIKITAYLKEHNSHLLPLTVSSLAFDFHGTYDHLTYYQDICLFIVFFCFLECRLPKTRYFVLLTALSPEA